MKKTITDIFADLIAFETTPDNSTANHEALAYIERFLSERGMRINRHEYEGHMSLVATTHDTTKPRIMLAAHIDVVPAPPRLFRLEERDGKFYGRGTYDMKFAVAAYLQLIDDIQESLNLYDIGIMITTDEELGGRHGVKALLDKAGYRAEACVLPDGGSNWDIEQAAKGLLWVVATARGTASHGSRPWEGQNAIEKMALFLQAVQRELFVVQNNNTSTFNIGMIRGGEAVNQVPATCIAEIDVRPVDREAQAAIVDQLNTLAAEYDVNVEYPLNDSPINVDLANPYVVAYVQSVEKAIGRSIGSVKSNGGSDARYFAAYDIPTLVGYPTGGGQHSDDEWLEVKSLYQFNDALHDFVEQTAQAAPTAASLATLQKI